MFISLSDSMKKSITKDFDYSFDGNLEGYEDLKFLEPVKAVGRYTAFKGNVDLKAHVTTTLLQTCSRCLKEFPEKIEIDVDEKLSTSVADDDYDTIQLSEGDSADLSEILTKDIISSLQIQTLCSEDCKGLCQKCGANLNDAACDCDTVQVDMRLEALKDLLEEV